MLPSRRLPLLGRPVVDVAVGVLRAPDGRVLLAERRPGRDAAGFWELPGGQVEPGESPSYSRRSAFTPSNWRPGGSTSTTSRPSG